MPINKKGEAYSQLLDDGMRMEREGFVSSSQYPPEGCSVLAYRQLAVLVLISSRLKEVTERLMEVEKLLKERGQ